MAGERAEMPSNSSEPVTMTVGDLRAALADVDDNAQIQLYYEDGSFVLVEVDVQPADVFTPFAVVTLTGADL
jgi:hypothetical protein